MDGDESNHAMRQLTLMMSRIDAFTGRELQLESLITDLESLLESLNPADSAWKTAFRSAWSNLESASVDLGPGGYDALPVLHKNVIKGAIQELTALVRRRMWALSPSAMHSDGGEGS